MHSQPSAAVAKEEELARFREEWKQEVLRRKAETERRKADLDEQEAGPASGSLPNGGVKLPAQKFTFQAGSSSKQTVTGPAATSYISSTYSKVLVSALDLYRQAIEHEQNGLFDEATRLYRDAFRRDPNVDRAYHREELLSASLAAQHIITHAKDVLDASAVKHREATISPTVPEGTIEQSVKLHKNALQPVTRLDSLMKDFPSELAFLPEDEEEPTHLEDFPIELLLHILRMLDPTTIERFATVSRKARIVTLDSSIWRELVLLTYKPPQIPDQEDLIPIVDEHSSDFRRVYIEQPRVRLDGVYIAVCHYVRAGQSDSAWVNFTQLITYHRYLRFFPDGQVLSLLVNEGHGPTEIIPLLKPGLRMKGLFVGTWRLSEATIYLENLVEASGKYQIAPQVATDKYSTETTLTIDPSCRYVFAMSLSLRSRPTGRWNQLKIESYESVNLETQDSAPVALKHERPYWFSKVRSYSAY